jgi:ATP-binding cassette subfamily F protein uup
LDSLPGHIEELETEQEQIHEKMAAPTFYKESGDEVVKLKARLERLETELEKAYERWEELEGIREGGS